MQLPETFSGLSRVGAQYWMAHRSWTARSIGDPVTGKSMEPETTKCSPLLWLASIRTTEVSESDCLHLTHCPTSTNIGSDLKTEWTFADVGRRQRCHPLAKDTTSEACLGTIERGDQERRS